MTTAYVYKWIENTTKKWYIGSRTAKNCHPDDRYICSSKIVKPLIKSNPNNWTREILETGDPVSMRILERDLLVCLDAAHSEYSYNRHNGGVDFSCIMEGDSNPSKRDDVRQKISNYMKGRKKSKESVEKSRKSRMGMVSSKKGVPLSEETKRKIAESRIGLKTGKPAWNTGIKMTEEFSQTMKNVTSGAKNGNFKGYSIGTNIDDGTIIVLCGNKHALCAGYNQKSINLCISGNRKSHKNHTWVRIKELTPELLEIYNNQ